MRISDYDQALTNKIKEVFPNVSFYDTDRIFPLHQEHKGSVRLPLVNIMRMGKSESNAGTSNSEVTRGYLFPSPEDELNRVEKVVRVDLVYQFDIISKSHNEVDDIWSEFVFWFKHNQMLLVPDKDNEGTNIECGVELVATDSADEMTNFDENGRLYRTVMTVEVYDAVITIDDFISKIQFVDVDIKELE